MREAADRLGSSRSTVGRALERGELYGIGGDAGNDQNAEEN